MNPTKMDRFSLISYMFQSLVWALLHVICVVGHVWILDRLHILRWIHEHTISHRILAVFVCVIAMCLVAAYILLWIEYITSQPESFLILCSDKQDLQHIRLQASWTWQQLFQSIGITSLILIPALLFLLAALVETFPFSCFEVIAIIAIELLGVWLVNSAYVLFGLPRKGVIMYVTLTIVSDFVVFLLSLMLLPNPPSVWFILATVLGPVGFYNQLAGEYHMFRLNLAKTVPMLLVSSAISMHMTIAAIAFFLADQCLRLSGLSNRSVPTEDETDIMLEYQRSQVYQKLQPHVPTRLQYSDFYVGPMDHPRPLTEADWLVPTQQEEKKENDNTLETAPLIISISDPTAPEPAEDSDDDSIVLV